MRKRRRRTLAFGDVSAREPFHEGWVAEDGDPRDSIATYIKHGDAVRLPAQVSRDRGLTVRDRAVHTPVAGAADGWGASFCGGTARQTDTETAWR